MERLVKSTKLGTNGHFHYVMYDTSDIEGSNIRVSLYKNHTHKAQVLSLPGIQEIDHSVIALTENDQTIQPGQKTTKAHLHDLTDEEILNDDSFELKIEKEKDSATTARLEKLIKTTDDRERKSKERGSLAEKMYIGEDQWIDDGGSIIELEGKRAKLTSNLIQPALKLLLGHHLQTRTDIKYTMIESSDSLIADVYTFIAKKELSNSNYEFNENQVVADQIISGRGNFICYVDYDKNILGDIKVKRLPWRQVYYGEHEEYTAEDANFVYTSTYMEKEKIVETYEEEVEGLASVMNVWEETFERELKDDSAVDWYDYKQKKFRIVECYEKNWKTYYSIVNDNESGSFISSSQSKFTDISQLESLGFTQIKRRKEYIRKYIMAYKTLLYTEIVEDELFEIVPVYCDKCGDKFWGRAILIVDLQRFYNKILSKVADYINKFVTSTHFYDKDTFPRDGDSRTEQVMSENISDPGALVEVNELPNVPQPMQNPIMPAWIINLLSGVKELIQTTINLNPAFYGELTAESGIKVMQNKQQALMGNESVFDNLAFSKKQLGKVLLAKIQQVYTPDRVVRLMESNDVKDSEFRFSESGEPVTGRTFTNEELMEIGRRFADKDSGKIDVEVVQSPYNPTAMMASYMSMLELVKSGQMPGIPEMLIEENPLIASKTRQKVMGYIQAFRQQEQQKEAAAQASEVNKTQIAAQSKIVTAAMKQNKQNTGGYPQ